jgi:hypothetical protein
MKCLEIREAVLARNHPDLATIYNNLGSLFDDKGDLEQAAEFYIYVLRSGKQSFQVITLI